MGLRNFTLTINNKNIMANQLTEKQMKERVKVICYGKMERMTRKEAIDKYFDGMMCCEGSEGERYKNIYCQLMLGEKTASDEL